jgi:iron-sulfur cluster assembly protein
MFTLTPSAAEQIAAPPKPGRRPAHAARRRQTRRQADGELVYGMGFDDEREDDLVIDGPGITVLISPRSLPLLENTTLDFTEVQPGEFQFIFRGGCTTPQRFRRLRKLRRRLFLINFASLRLR